MICPNCGKKLNNTALFCTYCGAKCNSNMEEKTPKHRNSKLLVAIASIVGVVCLMLAIVCVALVVSDKSNNSTNVSTSNDEHNTKNDKKNTKKSKTDDTEEATAMSEENNSTAEVAKTPDEIYEELISDKSPILGYWQAEGAGMYIGYNATGGDEGFTAYILINIPSSEESTYILLHERNGYTQSNDEGNIKYENRYKDNEYFEIVYNADGTLLLTGDLELYTGVKPVSYSFTPSQVDRSIINKFSGPWVGDKAFDFDTYTEYKIIYDENCGYIHENGDTKDSQRYHTDKCITLYNGIDTLYYNFPSQGLYGVYEDISGYIDDMYELDGDVLEYTVSQREGGLFGWIFVRENSKLEQISNAVYAYEEYVNDMYGSDDIECALIYIDDDYIPECVLRTEYTYSDIVLSWNNGKVSSCCGEFGTSLLYYREKTGELTFSESGGSFHEQEYYTLKNGEFIKRGVDTVFEGDNNIYEYYITEEQTIVSEPQYREYQNSFGDYDLSPNYGFSSVEAAYASFMQQFIN